MRDRSDFNEALTTLSRLHQEYGERQLRPVPFWKYQNWHSSSSSSSNSWWQWSDSWRSSWQLTRKSSTELKCRTRCLCRLFTKPQTCRFFFKSLLQSDRLQLIVVCCNRRVCVNTTPSHVEFSLEEKPPDGFFVVRGERQESSWHPGQIVHGQISGWNWEEMPSWRRSISGHTKTSTR